MLMMHRRTSLKLLGAVGVGSMFPAAVLSRRKYHYVAKLAAPARAHHTGGATIRGAMTPAGFRRVVSGLLSKGYSLDPTSVRVRPA